jgi:uncharacterized protein (UPF0332 family)
MTPRAAQLLDDAGRTIASARDGLETAGAAVAAQSVSAAMLTLAQACLEADGLAPTTAQAICVAYGERFARTRRLYSAYYRWLLDSADLGRAASGQIAASIDSDSAATAVERAEIFRDAVERFLDGSG